MTLKSQEHAKDEVDHEDVRSSLVTRPQNTYSSSRSVVLSAMNAKLYDTDNQTARVNKARLTLR